MLLAEFPIQKKEHSTFPISDSYHLNEVNKLKTTSKKDYRLFSLVDLVSLLNYL